MCERNELLELMLAEMSDKELSRYIYAHASIGSQELLNELATRWRLLVELDQGESNAQGEQQTLT